MKLTKRGEHAYRFGATVTPAWWDEVWKKANTFADQDGDLDLFWQERIDGMIEMRDKFYEFQDTRPI